MRKAPVDAAASTALAMFPMQVSMLVHRRIQPLRVIAAAVAVLLVAMTFVLVTAPAASASTFVQTDVIDGDSVIGGGSSVSPDGCLQTDWSFQANIDFDGRHSVSYFSSTADICRGERTLVTGQTYDGVVEISSLRSARVVATVPLSDGGEVRIDNTFDAFGPAETGNSKFVLRFDRTMLQIISNGQWKQALSGGALPLDFAVITQATSAEVLIITKCDFCG
jgi:hypothetical protein